MAASDDQETNFDPRRRLCPDGSCVGIIGGDGKCTVCGTVDQGYDTTSASTAHDSQDSDDEPVDGEHTDDSLGAEPSSSGFDPNRRLCSDDTCVGVVGKDNRCSVCGRSADA
jgi:hypothetical protein